MPGHCRCVGLLFALGAVAIWVGCSSEPEAKPGKAPTGTASKSAKSKIAGDAAKTAKNGKPTPTKTTTSKPKPKPKPEPSIDSTLEVRDDPKKHQPFVLDLGSKLKMEFVWIPRGSFAMGDPNEGLSRRRARIEEPFYLAKHEVTQAQWELLMKTNPSVNKERDTERPEDAQRPVEHVNWDDVQAFLKVLNQKYSKSGKRFALPTEVQWEWACKAGHSMRVNSTEDPDRMPRYAWIGGNSDRETHPVGTKEPNDWGLYDMHGNVAEFVADVASGESGKHVVRGGEWRRGASECSCTARVLREAKVPFRCDGFRVMCTPAN